VTRVTTPSEPDLLFELIRLTNSNGGHPPWGREVAASLGCTVDDLEASALGLRNRGLIEIRGGGRLAGAIAHGVLAVTAKGYRLHGTGLSR
jgi:hypothetical protein